MIKYTHKERVRLSKDNLIYSYTVFVGNSSGWNDVDQKDKEYFLNKFCCCLLFLLSIEWITDGATMNILYIWKSEITMISLIISYSISKRTSNKLILQTEYIPIRQKWTNSSKCDGRCHIKRVVEKESFRHVCIYLSIIHKKYGSIGTQRTVFFQPVIILLSCRALVFAQFHI